MKNFFVTYDIEYGKGALIITAESALRAIEIAKEFGWNIDVVEIEPAGNTEKILEHMEYVE